MDFDTTVGFASLFAGRTGAWFDSTRTACHHGPVTLDLYRQHLAGQAEIGVYPVREDGRCHWGCVDFDDDDAHERALAFAACAEWHGIRGWVERSRSKGFHVWYFFAGAMHARLVRDVGRAIDLGAGTECPEINPKSTDQRKIVNCVRLPYARAAAPGRMVVVDEADREVPVRDFVRQALDHRIERGLAEHVAALAPLERPPASSVSALLRMRGLIGTPARGGETEGTVHLVYRGELEVRAGTRDNTFWVLANYCKGMGLTEEQAVAKVAEVWQDQTEQAGFPLEQAVNKVRRVYAGEEMNR